MRSSTAFDRLALSSARRGTPIGRVTTCLSLTLLVSLGVACAQGPQERATSSSVTGNDGDDTSATEGVTITTSASMTTQGETDSASGSTTDAADSTDSEDSVDSGNESTDDGDDDTTETGEMLEEVTIYEIRDGTIPTGTDVVVRGVIVTGVRDNGFFAQEADGGPFSAVWVYAGNGPDVSALAIGDEVDFVGFTDEHFGLTEVAIFNGSVEVTSTPNPAPAPTVLDLAVLDVPAQADPWQSVLVRIEDDVFIVTSINQHDELTLEDGDGASVMVDDFLYSLVADLVDLDVGATFTAVQGPLNYSFSNYKIAPRSGSDVEGYTP
jgi:hypothetical protein